MQKHITKIFLIPVAFLMLPNLASAEIYSVYALINFDDIQPNIGTSQLPNSSSVWQWNLDSYQNDIWTNTVSHDGTSDYIKRYSPPYNNDHMGWENFGFLEIDNTKAVKGNSLKYTITGGKNSNYPNGIGALVRNKSEYIALDRSTVINGIAGMPYLYLTNGTVGSNAFHQPLAAAKTNPSNNKFTFYIKGDPSLTIGLGGYDKAPWTTWSIGTFSGTGYTGGSHYYHDFAINGGQWTKLILGSYPDWNNAGFHPATQIVNYIPQFFGVYLANGNYTGTAMTPYSTWMDEFQFEYDNYAPQNSETINNIAIEYYPVTKIWEIGFRDKYWALNQSKASYELRYSFSPITNENWNSATPVHTQANPSFRIEDRTDGRFKRNNLSAYSSLWAQFKLMSSADEDIFLSNKRIYFAIKDISQDLNDLHKINPGLTGNLVGNGRDYINASSTFDYATDSQFLPYISRFFYDLPSDEIVDVVPPAAPTGLSIH